MLTLQPALILSVPSNVPVPMVTPLRMVALHVKILMNASLVLQNVLKTLLAVTLMVVTSAVVTTVGKNLPTEIISVKMSTSALELTSLSTTATYLLIAKMFLVLSLALVKLVSMMSMVTALFASKSMNVLMVVILVTTSLLALILTLLPTILRDFHANVTAVSKVMVIKNVLTLTSVQLAKIIAQIILLAAILKEVSTAPVTTASRDQQMVIMSVRISMNAQKVLLIVHKTQIA